MLSFSFSPLVRYPWRKGCLPPPDPIQPKRKGRRTQKRKPFPFPIGFEFLFPSKPSFPFYPTIRNQERKKDRKGFERGGIEKTKRKRERDETDEKKKGFFFTFEVVERESERVREGPERGTPFLYFHHKHDVVILQSTLRSRFEKSAERSCLFRKSTFASKTKEEVRFDPISSSSSFRIVRVFFFTKGRTFSVFPLVRTRLLVRRIRKEFVRTLSRRERKSKRKIRNGLEPFPDRKPRQRGRIVTKERKTCRTKEVLDSIVL